MYLKNVGLDRPSGIHPDAEYGDRRYCRRFVALSNSFHAGRAMCHANFAAQLFESTNNPGQGVGALTPRVPVRE